MSPPPPFGLSPTALSVSAAVDSMVYADVTVIATHGPLVISNPSALSGDVQRADGWPADPEARELHDPAGFYPDAIKTYHATLTVTRCTSWGVDPTWGFIVCTATGASETVALIGDGT